MPSDRVTVVMTGALLPSTATSASSSGAYFMVLVALLLKKYAASASVTALIPSETRMAVLFVFIRKTPIEAPDVSCPLFLKMPGFVEAPGIIPCMYRSLSRILLSSSTPLLPEITGFPRMFISAPFSSVSPLKLALLK